MNKMFMVVNVDTGETIRVNGDHHLSKNFTVHEFRCTPKSEVILYSGRLVKYLQHLRDQFGWIQINSAHRELSFNTEIGGFKDSEHLYGLAVDIKCNGVSIDRLFKACIEVGGHFCNVGKYTNHVHFGIKGYHRRA